MTPTSTTIKEWRCRRRSKGLKEKKEIELQALSLSLWQKPLPTFSFSIIFINYILYLFLHWNIIPYCNYFLKVFTLKRVYFSYTFKFCNFTFSLLSTKFNWCVIFVIEIQCLIRSRLPCATTTYHPPLMSLVFGCQLPPADSLISLSVMNFLNLKFSLFIYYICA